MIINKAVEEDNLSRVLIEFDGLTLNISWLKSTIKEASLNQTSNLSRVFPDNSNPTFSSTNIMTFNLWKDTIEVSTDLWEYQKANIWFMLKSKILTKVSLKLITPSESAPLQNLRNFMSKKWALMNLEN